MSWREPFRDPAAVARLGDLIARTITRPWTLMEVCGGQTHAIVRYGLDALLPPGVTLLHGPGCPVCVTPIEVLDQALAIARRPEVVFCSFGDMLRVPGTDGDLLAARAAGADVRVVYSPLDAVALAARHPDRQVVFFAVGFETTAPAHAIAAQLARRQGLRNFSLLVSHVLVPPALEAILAGPERRVDGFLAAGHVCTVMGTAEYAPIAARHRVPIVITGFEPVDLLRGLATCLALLEAGRAEVVNAYARVAPDGGNPVARAAVEQVFAVRTRKWRGVGALPASGLGLAPAWAELDAALRFGVADLRADEPAECLAGQVLMGARRPPECPAFGTRCTPEHPLGAPMVSSEGACAAYHRFRSREVAR